MGIESERSKVLILLNSKSDMHTAGKLIKGFMSHYGSKIQTNVTLRVHFKGKERYLASPEAQEVMMVSHSVSD